LAGWGGQPALKPRIDLVAEHAVDGERDPEILRFSEEHTPRLGNGDWGSPEMLKE
jgi:hypothetical protein